MLTFNPFHLASEALGRQQVIAQLLEAGWRPEPHASVLNSVLR